MFLQKLNKMYSKIFQNTKFVYILYTKIVKIKVYYNNECTKNAHQIPTYIQKYTNCTKTLHSLFFEFSHLQRRQFSFYFATL